MPYRDAKTLAAREQVQARFVKRAAKLVNVFQCLIVSADAQRREMLERAAAEGGWKTFICSDEPAALKYLGRSLVQLAVVDFEGQRPDAFRAVVEQITARGGLLLIVCGNEGNIDEEVWVRQQGAWLYLPGVVDGANFTSLCGEARQIADRLWRANGHERMPGRPAAQHNSYS